MRRAAEACSPLIAGLAAVTLGLAGCDADTSAWTSGAPAPPPTATADGYIAPPNVTAVEPVPQGLKLTGAGRPGARVRLGPPAGEAMFAVSDKSGAWTLTLPPSSEVRLFGLSMSVGDRAVQSEGYLMVLPGGRVVQLRAGAGAWSLAKPTALPRLLTVDHDGEGGAVISGSAPAGGAFQARIDRSSVVGGRAGPDGHFALALSEPLRVGTHEIELVGDEGRDSVSVPISPPEPLATPFRGEQTSYGRRVDWMTPGGGLQTTLVLDRPGVGA